jgi:uncharacterized protein YmfQ (DUF2313 family)
MTTIDPTTQVPKQAEFVPFSDELNTQSKADNLPNGELFRAKNIPETNFRRLLYALALEIGRTETKIEELADDYYIWTTTNLLTFWERTVGIPDGCFKIKNVSVEQRRKNVIAKLALMNVITEEDFVNLAAFFGITIEIESGIENHGGVFPVTFPMIFTDTFKEARFTMVVKFLNEETPNVFPYTFPMTFIDDPTEFMRCIIKHLKPAYCRVVFVYLG